MIEIIIQPRRTGKTYKLIEKAAKENLYIVCPNITQVKDVARRAKEDGLNIPHPITWYEFISQKYYGKNINGFLIDNLDMCIQSMTQVEIKAVTLNGASNA